MKKLLPKKKIKRVKAWAVLEERFFNELVRPHSELAVCAGAIATFLTRKEARFFAQHPRLRIVPATITYTLSSLAPARPNKNK